MGQDLGKECGCGFEASDDVAEDQRLQQEYQAKDKSAASQGTSAAAATSAASSAQGRGGASGNQSAWAGQPEQEGFFVPPPQPEASQKAAPSAPSKAAAGSSSHAPAASSAARPYASAGIANFDVILQDLEGAEQAAYMAAFKSLSDGKAALQIDHVGLRNFVLLNSAVTEQDLDTELLKIASTNEEFAVDGDSFVMLLRTNPVNDSKALEVFISLSGDGEQISSEDCRTGLYTFLQTIGESYTGERSERIIDSVMSDAGLQVSMEQWVGYTKTAGRIARLANYAKV